MLEGRDLCKENCSWNPSQGLPFNRKSGFTQHSSVDSESGQRACDHILETTVIIVV